MKTILFQWTFALGTLLLLWPANAGPAVPPAIPDADAIAVTRVSNAPGVWNVTLPAGSEGKLYYQMSLVIDGSENDFASGNVPLLAGCHCRISANVSNDMDTHVKDVLRVQGFPVKENVTVYDTSVDVAYGETLHHQSQHSASTTFRKKAFPLYYPFPVPEGRYKVSDKITILDDVMLDETIMADNGKAYGPIEAAHLLQKGLPSDLIHHVQIKVQFIPATYSAFAPQVK